MPPCDYKNYPSNWKAIREEILDRSHDRCECLGECGKPNNGVHDPLWKRCRETNRRQALGMRGLVVLTIAHLCHKTRCALRRHLKAMCQGCHNRYDMPMRVKNRKAKRDREDKEFERSLQEQEKVPF